MNKVILMGRLTRDPEIETTVNNSIHAKFTIAVDRRFAREGYQQTDFVPISVWGKTAEFASMYFKKGMRVVVSGRLELNQYQDKASGEQRTFTQVTAEELHFADAKRDNNSNPFGFNDNQEQFSDNKGDVEFSELSGDNSFNIDDDFLEETVDDVNFDE